VGLAAERARGLPVMLLVTFRPELTPPWARHANATLLMVGRLAGREVAAMIEGVAGGRALPAAVAAEVAAKADGMPLFVEELTRAVLEARPPGEEAERGGVAAGAPLPPMPVPTTLRDALMARLDRAPAARELAQVAAAIGREFRHDLLAAVAPPPGGRGLEERLAPLIEAGLVSRRGAAAPEAAYAFKHALVRDAAYESLLRGKRRELHARIARALEERFPGTAEREPELLAHHCAEAGLAEAAAAYRHQAGRRAMARSALAEAVAQLRAGLDTLAGLPDEPERRRLEFDLQLALATALIAASGYGAPETGVAFARARELCRGEDDPHRLFPVLNGQVLFHALRGEPRAAHATAAEMLERAERSGEDALLIPAHRAASLACWHFGRFAAMRAHAERVLALYDPARHRGLASLYGFDQRAVALAHLTLALLVLGHPDQARRRGAELLAWARDLRHPNSLAQALHMLCHFHIAARDSAAARQTAEEQIALAAERGLPFFLGHGRLFRGLALVAQDLHEDGLADVERGRAELLACGTLIQGAGAAAEGEVAAAHAQAGHLQEALRWTTEACATMDQAPSFWKNAEKHRCRGEVLLMFPEPDWAGAEACFRRAVEIARPQGARWWELRAAVSLARLLRDRGRRAEARDLLAPVYGWFTEGFDLPDLREAGALLEALA